MLNGATAFPPEAYRKGPSSPQEKIVGENRDSMGLGSRRCFNERDVTALTPWKKG